MRNFIRVMKALSDPNRVKIMKMLEQKEMCVCEIQAGLGLAQPTVSKHLKVLEDADLVNNSRDGVWVNYRINPSGENEYAQVMIKNLEGWVNEDPSVTGLMEQLSELDREKIVKNK